MNKIASLIISGTRLIQLVQFSNSIFFFLRRVFYDFLAKRSGHFAIQLVFVGFLDPSIGGSNDLIEGFPLFGLGNLDRMVQKVEDLRQQVRQQQKQIYELRLGKVTEQDMTIDALELSVRSHKCLENAGVVTVLDLVRKTEPELLKIKNFGRKSLNEVKEVLAEMGLPLAMGR